MLQSASIHKKYLINISYNTFFNIFQYRFFDFFRHLGIFLGRNGGIYQEKVFFTEEEFVKEDRNSQMMK